MNKIIKLLKKITPQGIMLSVINNKLIDEILNIPDDELDDFLLKNGYNPDELLKTGTDIINKCLRHSRKEVLNYTDYLNCPNCNKKIKAKFSIIEQNNKKFIIINQSVCEFCNAEIQESKLLKN
jgi:hypothetical protein